MSESDIYKKREPMPVGKSRRAGPQRRRRKSNRPFDDDKQRKRRSRNSGFRRVLHLARKKENEKFFWWSMLISIVILLTLIGLWQFVFQEITIQEERQRTEQYRSGQEQHRIPENTDR